MKKQLLLIALASLVILAACKKDTIDVAPTGNVEIPAGMSGSDIIVTNFSEEVVPNENGDFAIGHSKMLVAKNSENGKTIYISNLTADYDITRGNRQQNYELSAKETALHYALCLIPFGTYQSKDATFNSMKEVLYELPCVKDLESAIETTVNQYGYLKTDEIQTEMVALWEYFRADLLDQFFENGKSANSPSPFMINKIELKKDGTIESSIPYLPVSRFRGVRLDINASGTHFNEATNTWTLSMTGYNENGVYIGLNKGTIGSNGQASPSTERIRYYLPPMNVGKFMDTFTSYSGIRAYFQDTWRLFFESGFGFDDMTWDMAKLDGISLELGRNDNAIMLMSPKDSQETAVINVVYASLQTIGFVLDNLLDSQGIDAFFLSLLDDAEFVSSVYANYGGGLGNFATIAIDVLERLADFLVAEGIHLMPGMNLDMALDYISDDAARAVLELAGNELGMMASWGLFDSFGLAVEAEFNNDLPSVSTQSYEVLSSNDAIVVAELQSMGTVSITEVGVCYSTTMLPSVNDICVYYTDIQTTGSYQCQLGGLQPNTTYYARAYAKCPLDIVVYGNEVRFTTLSSGGGGGGGGGGIHEYVDLGLPSGTLWATCNIGANTPEEYGDYFAWGETQTKDTYSWSTYQYANGTFWQDPQLTKYCTDANYGYNGFTDNLTSLLPEDDAATANWGNGWRMPTEEEWSELLDNTTSAWYTQNGAGGVLMTALNGNTIFFPAAGLYIDNSTAGEGEEGDYWTNCIESNQSIPNSGYQISGKRMGFNTLNGQNYWFGGCSPRCWGCSVRAVRSSREE